MDYGIMWQEFDREGTLVTRKRVFQTEQGRCRFIDRLIKRANFYDLVALHN